MLQGWLQTESNVRFIELVHFQVSHETPGPGCLRPIRGNWKRRGCCASFPSGEVAVLFRLAPAACEFLQSTSRTRPSKSSADSVSRSSFTLARFARLLHERHEISELFVAHLLSRYIRYEADLVDQLFNSSEKRLARILLLLSHFGKESRAEPVLPESARMTWHRWSARPGRGSVTS